MECLDELSLGIRGQTLGKDKDYPPVASPTTIDHMASTSDVPQTSFDALHQSLVHLGLAISWEQDPTLSESVRIFHQGHHYLKDNTHQFRINI